VKAVARWSYSGFESAGIIFSPSSAGLSGRPMITVLLPVFMGSRDKPANDGSLGATAPDLNAL
jgi:hypothetical protein